jgi:hypothetical protein
MACFVNAFAKLSTAKCASFDDIRKGNLHNENIIFVKKRASQTSAECDQQFYYWNYQLRNVQLL